jgi:methylthioribose-1-phosphate isomerase
VDYGSATSPIYAAHDAGIPVHVFIDETRPRNQGASLTAWELGKHGVSHDIVVDNAGGHLMQHGLVDAVIVGSDRTTVTGDVANKIGTYLKALAARDNGVPFYVALPSSTFDWELTDGVEQIPIEERNPHEVLYVGGYLDGARREVRICPEGATARNYGFDVTPSRLVTGLITERGVCRAERESILTLYPEKRAWTKAT